MSKVLANERPTLLVLFVEFEFPNLCQKRPAPHKSLFFLDNLIPLTRNISYQPFGPTVIYKKKYPYKDSVTYELASVLGYTLVWRIEL